MQFRHVYASRATRLPSYLAARVICADRAAWHARVYLMQASN